MARGGAATICSLLTSGAISHQGHWLGARTHTLSLRLREKHGPLEDSSLTCGNEGPLDLVNGWG